MTDRDTSEQDGSRKLWAFGALGALAVGIGLYLLIPRLMPEPQAKPAPPKGALVTAVSPTRAEAVSIAQTGFVQPAARLMLSSEVAGRIARIDPGFRVGARVRAGTVLAELDRARFEADVAAAEARLAGAEARRDTARSNVDRQSRLDDGGFAAEARVEEVRTALASADADVGLARADLQRARIALDDTRIVAPFDAVVDDREIALGQIVSPGTTVGSLVDAATAEIDLGLLPRQRALLDTGDALVGRAVTIVRPASKASDSRAGRVAAIDPSLDPIARTLELVIVIDDPFDGDALRVGELVGVEIPVASETAAWIVPASALKGNDKLYLIDADDTLRALRPEILRRGQDDVQVASEALSTDSRLLLTNLSSAVDGQRVRLEDGSSAR